MKKFYQQIPGFGGLIFSYVFTITLFSTLLIISATKLKRIDQVVIGTLVSGFALIFFTNNLRLFVKAPGTIQIDSEHILASFYRNRMVKIQLADITHIAGIFGVSSVIKVCYQLAQRQKSFLIHIDKLRVGEKFQVGDLVEKILEHAPNLQEADVEKFTDQMFRRQIAWGKEPDWTIINTAKRRAEENRKNLTLKEEKETHERKKQTIP